MDLTNYLKETAQQRGVPEIGLKFTLHDDGSHSFSLKLGDLSVPVENSDPHALAMANLVEKYLQ